LAQRLGPRSVTRRPAVTGAVVVGLVLAACAVVASPPRATGGHAGMHAAAAPPAVPQRTIVLDPATGAMIGQAPAGTVRIVVLDPATGEVVSSVG